MKIDSLRIAILIASMSNLISAAPASGKVPFGISTRTRITHPGAAFDQKPDYKPGSSAEVDAQSRTGLAEAQINKLQGNWQVVRWEDESGQPASAEEMKDFILSFEADQLTMRKGKDDPGTKCQYRIDPSKEPKWIDMGMPGLTPGAIVLEGIYSLEGDDLSLCITSGLRNGIAPPRPTEFKTKPNEKYAVLVLKRIP